MKTNKETIYVKDQGEIIISPKKIQIINSTHVDKPKRIYEIWEGCRIGKNKIINLFVIRKHSPWVDQSIINDNNLIHKFLNYTQQKENKVVQTYKITSDIVITEYHPNWSPLIIKSANNFYPPKYIKNLQDRFYKYFSDKKYVNNFCGKILNSLFKLSK